MALSASENFQNLHIDDNSSDALIAFLEQRLDKLVELSIDMAKRNGYAPFTTTIRAAWIEAISSVTQSLGLYLSKTKNPPIGPRATMNYQGDERFFKMLKVARVHRSLGITMTMYVGLLKHFRNLFIKESALIPGGISDELHNKIRDFFDEVELAVAEDWKALNSDARIRELQESAHTATLDKDRYFAIFESLQNPAFLLDKSYDLINANQFAVELYLDHSEPGEIVYLPSDERKKTLSDIIDRILQAINDGRSSITLPTRQGQRHFDIHMRALHDSVQNIAIGHVVLLNDITTHREETEKAQESERSMSRFMAMMSHEIRTPLHSVLGASELLRAARPGETGTYLNLLDSAAQTLLQTLNNVLDYSKLQNGTPKPVPTRIHLASKISEFNHCLDLSLNREKAKLRFHIQRSLPEYIEIDWALTQQVLNNLIINSVHADDKKQGVDICLSGSAHPLPRIRFEVRDYGPGLPAIDARALFNSFDKAEARQTRGGGTGLGLAIAHNIVEAMQGEIGYSNYDDGALVWFEFPFRVSDAKHKEPETQKPDNVLQLKGINCLLVDDDPVGCLVTTSQLEQLGFDVKNATSCEEALKLASKEQFDFYIVDYLLPDGTGPELAKKLRQSSSREACFLALTANVEALRADEHIEQRFDLVIAKPADLNALSVALKPQSTSQGLNQAHTTKNSLDGLSLSTIQAMIIAFENAWSAFLQDIEEEDLTDHLPDLTLTIHRLAGSTAILGLEELESKLRFAENILSSEKDHSQTHEAIKALEINLDEIKSWQVLRKISGAP